MFHSLRYLLVCVSISGILVTPAVAEIITFQGDDERLYLNQSRETVSTFGGGWNRYGGGVGGYQGNVYETFISKGQVRISDDRFIELIERSGSDNYLIEKIRERRAATAFWGWTTVGLFAASPAIGYATYATTQHMFVSNPLETGMGNAEMLGLGAFSAAYIAGLVAFTVWCFTALERPMGPGLDFTPKRVFSNEEAYDAIRAYNRLLEQNGN